MNCKKVQFIRVQNTMATNADDFEEFHHKLRNNDGDRSESEEPSPTSNNLDILIQHLTKRDALLERLVDKLTVGTAPMSTTCIVELDENGETNIPVINVTGRAIEVKEDEKMFRGVQCEEVAEIVSCINQVREEENRKPLCIRESYPYCKEKDRR
ncbi:hypothetical protein QE152_g5214 [Popillia japonica]|uniref:Uncharacterized protein n=1 Tax=Popillia japonica TaxID=7064 RepID=A0AAW1MQG3_POPJA